MTEEKENKKEKENYFSSLQQEDNLKPLVKVGSDHDKSDGTLDNDVHEKLLKKKNDFDPKQLKYNKKMIYLKMFVCAFIFGCVSLNAFSMFWLLILNEKSNMSFTVTHIINLLLVIFESFLFTGIMLYLLYRFFRDHINTKPILDFFNEV